MANKQLQRVGHYELDYQHVLGEGNNSQVVLGTDVESGAKVAVKIFNKKQLSDRANKMVDIEIATLRRLPPHAHIIRLLDVLDLQLLDGVPVQAGAEREAKGEGEGEAEAVHGEQVDKVDGADGAKGVESMRYVVHEYIEQGDLFEYVLTHPLSEQHCKQFFFQIVKAVHFLHKHGVIHHDIKLENVGLRKGGSLVLMDFGYCCEFSNDVQLSRFCGTLSYCAPELLLGKPYNATPIDVWSLGVVLYVMLFKKFPFNSDSPDMLYKQASSRDYIRSMLHTDLISEDARDLLFKIFVPLVYKRISVSEILRHQFLKDIDGIDSIVY